MSMNLDAAYRTVITCEGKQLNIVCDEGTHVKLIRANFGRFSISICNEHGNLEWSVDCVAQRSFRVMQESCGKKQNCSIPASSSYFGDPCPGTHKYLEVQYRCLPDLPKRRSQSSTPRLEVFKHQTPPPIVIPTRKGQNSDSKTDRPAIDSSEKNGYTNRTSSETNSLKSKEGFVISDDETKSSTVASTSSASVSVSTSKSDYKNEDNGIYVRHPHPRFPEKGSSSSTTSTTLNTELKNNATLARGGVKDTSSDSSVEETLHQQFSSTKTISEATGGVLSTQSSPTLVSSVDVATHCPPAESRNLSWNWTRIHQFAYQPCPSASKGTAKWYCSFESSEPRWVPAEVDMSNCTSHWVLLLEEAMINKEFSVTNLATKLSQMTRIKTLYGGDIHKVTDIVNQLVNRMESVLEEISDYRLRNQFVKDILNSIQDSCNNLLEDFQRNSWLDLPPHQRYEVATHLIWALERISVLLSETNTANSDYGRIHSNIYIGVHTRLSKNINEGIELPFLNNLVSANNNESSVSDVGHSVNNSTVYLLLMSNRVYLPLQTLKQAEKDSVIRAALVLYTKLGNLLTANKDSLESNVEDNENATLFVNSHIVGLMLNKERLPFNAKVKLILQHLVTANVTNPKCVFWDVVRLKWSPNGCRVIRWNKTHTTCECDHLTNFAVLMQIKEIPMIREQENAFRVITIFGCSVSIFCLVLTLAMFLFCKNLKGDRIAIHTNLCLCLLIGELVFLFGINQTNTIMLCRVVALLLHYIFLCAFLWLFFEGFRLYVMLIEVFESERSRLRYYYFFSYGIPFVIVSICVYLDPYSYGTAKHCWLRTDNYFILSFVGPVVAIVVSNLVFLSIALCVMWKHISSAASVTIPEKDENKMKSLRLWLRGALALVFLLDITWTFGLLYLNQETLIMAYLFTIFNSSQGLFILIFHCLQNEKLLSGLQMKSNCLFSVSRENSSVINGGEKRKSANQSLDATSVSNNQNMSQNLEPIIAPHSGSALTPTLRRVTTPSGAKYFITGKAHTATLESDYGFRRIAEEMRNRQKQRCRAHCDHLSRNALVEHVYECIDDSPYTAKMFVSSACACVEELNRSQSDSSIERDDCLDLNEKPNAFQELKLPAIICDNSTVISKSNCKAIASPKYRKKLKDEKHNIVAKLNGKQVITSAVCNPSPDTIA